MIIDRLFNDVEKKGCVCVGLDTSFDYIPEIIKKKYDNIEDAIFEYNRRIIDSVHDTVGCFKVQIAYYEAFGIKGLIAYKRTLKYIRDLNSIVIADIKRGDIAATAKMYAKAHFTGDFEADFITLSPYMGMDSIEPYLEYVKNKEKGLFVLVRTSNKGFKDFEAIENKAGEPLFKSVGDRISELSRDFRGECGYSSIGGVLGCTHREEAEEIRNMYKNMFFLIPGYGAQGGGGEDVKAYLNNGRGGIVNSSRGILLNYKNYSDGEEKFDIYAREAVLKMKEDIEDAIKL